MEEKNKIKKYSSIVLFSGGIDSFLLSKYIKKYIDPNTKLVYYNLGHKYASEEIEHIKSLAYGSEVLILNNLNLGNIELEDAHIYNRNLLIAIHASTFSDRIFIGGSLSDRVGDNNKQVFNSLSILLSRVNNKWITIDSPFYDNYKCEIARLLTSGSNKLCTRRELIENTFSCFNPIDKRRVNYFDNRYEKSYTYFTKECLNCPACFRKGVVLNHIDINRPFYNIDLVKEYRDKFINDVNDSPRKYATLKYCSEINS